MKRFLVTLQIDTANDKTAEDVEWAVHELFYDDDDGNPNFTVGAVCVPMVQEIEPKDAVNDFEE